MNKLVILALASLACLAFVDCGIEEWKKEWKGFMEDKFCKSEDEADREHFLKCSEMIPDIIKKVIFDTTGETEMKEAMTKMCDADMGKKVCDSMKEKKEDFEKVSDEEVKAIMDCKNNKSS